MVMKLRSKRNAGIECSIKRSHTKKNIPRWGTVRNYGYRALDVTKRNFHLLKLHPGSFKEAISCTLEEHSIVSEPGYDALSYTWQPIFQKRFIRVGDETGVYQLRIGRNLWAALFHLRNLENSRLLWVDAVCIDQNNIQERGHQVALMRHVYSKATNVTIWLGPEPVLEKPLKSNGKRTKHPAGSLISHDSSELFAKGRKCTEDGPFLSAIFESKWFTRAWILQEVVLARNILVRYGPTQFPWAKLIEATEVSKLSHSAVETIESMHLMRDAHSRNYTPSIEEVVYANRHADCHDERDRFYSVLSLKSEA